jgi:hypothetical protein
MNILLYLSVSLFISKYKPETYRPKTYIPIKKTKNIFKNFPQQNTIYLDKTNTLSQPDLSIEHICPKSYCKNILNAKYDMHNLFLTDININKKRSNYKFVDERSNNNNNNNNKRLKT